MALLDFLNGQVMAMDPRRLEAIVSVVRDHDLGKLRVDLSNVQAVLQENQKKVEAGRRNFKYSGGEIELDAVGDTCFVHVYNTLFKRNFGMLALSSGASTYARIKREIVAANEIEDISRIVLLIDSGGGQADGLHDLHAFIMGSQKPVHAHIDGCACSAAYYLATAATTISASADSIIGHIGCIMTHVDRTAKNKKEGYKVTYIYAGERKADGRPDVPLSDRARAENQMICDHFYAGFIAAVALGRNRSEDYVAAEMADARIFMSEAAVTAGLIDSVGSVEESLAGFIDRAPASREGAAVLAGGGRAVSELARLRAENTNLRSVVDHLRARAGS